jgi:hypothetical protein
MSDNLYKIVKLKTRSDFEIAFNLPSSVKVFVANEDDSCNFAVDFFKNVEDNVSLACYIIEKMTRAYHEGYIDCIDEHEF